MPLQAVQFTPRLSGARDTQFLIVGIPAGGQGGGDDVKVPRQKKRALLL